MGRSFSATDLLAAALGTCIATNIDRVAVRHAIPLAAIEVAVTKELATRPKRITKLDVLIRIAVPVATGVAARLRRAAESCVVHRSLHPELAVGITIEGGQRG